MFRKPFHKSSQRLLKGSEQRKLVAQLQAQFPLLSESQLEALCPKGAQITEQRLPDRVCIYLHGSTPLWFTTDQAGVGERAYPSLYMLHVAPQILPAIRVHAGLGKKLLTTDLFMPGILLSHDADNPRADWVVDNFGHFDKNALVAICEEDEWAPVAIGTWCISADELRHMGMKGRGVAMVHCIDDLLWQLGHGKIPKQAPASAAKAVEDYECRRREAAAAAAAQVEFEKQQHAEALRRQQLEELPKMLRRKEKALRQIMDLKAMADSGAVVLDEDQRSKLGKVDSLRQEMAEIKAQLDALTISPQPQGSCHGNGPDPGAAAGTGLERDMGIGEEAVADDGEAEETSAAQTDDGDAGNVGDSPATAPTDAISMDTALTEAFLVALHTSITDASLPVLASSLWGQHIAPASAQLVKPIAGASATSPEDTGLSIKATSWKKLAAFLADMQQLGLIGLEEPKRGVQVLARVNRSHEMYASFSVDEHVKGNSDGVENGEQSEALGKDRAQWKLPTKGSKVILIKLTKRSGTKNVTVVSNLENFGIAITDDLRRDIAKRFSVSATAQEGPDKSQGTLLLVQGKYVTQLQKYLSDKYSIPMKHIQVEASGVTKKDKAVNV